MGMYLSADRETMTMGVRILREDPAERCTDTDFVRVSTSSDPKDGTVTLATIQRIVEKTKRTLTPGSLWHVKTLIMDQPMSLDAAVGFAARYAERKKIPVVYTEQGSSEQDSPRTSRA